QLLQAGARQAVFREAVLAQDVLDRARGARGRHRLVPSRRPVGAHDAGELLARGELGGAHAGLLDLAVREVLEAVAHAAHVQRLGELRLEAGAYDELGRAAADVDHQAALVFYSRRHGHGVRYAQVNEARLLASRDHLDREAEHLARLAQELR